MGEIVLSDAELAAIEACAYGMPRGGWNTGDAEAQLLADLRDGVSRLVAEVRRLREVLRSIVECGVSFSLDTSIEGEWTDCYGCEKKVNMAEIALNGWLG